MAIVLGNLVLLVLAWAVVHSLMKQVYWPRTTHYKHPTPRLAVSLILTLATFGVIIVVVALAFVAFYTVLTWF